MKSFFGYCAVAAVMWLGAFGTANAVFVRGIVEPAFTDDGSTTDGLDWTATIGFDVGAECLVPGVTTCYSVSNFSLTGELTFNSETIPLDFGLFPPNPIPSPIDLEVDSSGIVTGIGTPEVGPSAHWAFTSSLGDGYAWIKFNLPSHEGTNGAFSSADLFLQFCNDLGLLPSISLLSYEDDCFPATVCGANRGAADQSQVFAHVEISQTPEPGSLLLLLGALSASWFVRRRQQLR
jgi:hypothetical protein